MEVATGGISMFVKRSAVLLITLAMSRSYFVRSDVTDNSVNANISITTASSASPSFSDQPPDLRNVSYSNATDIIVKMMSQKCSKTYSLTCFKLDLVRFVDRLGHLPSYQLLPGVALVHVYSNDATAKELPTTLLHALAQGNVSNELDDFLATRINQYLNSFTLSVKLLDQNTVTKAQEIGTEILDGFSKDVQKGRKKGYGGAMWAAGTIATIGMASLAAMAGKALMTSMLALMLAAAGAMRGGGGMAAGGGGGGGGEKCAHHYITAHGRNMDMQELMQKPIDMSGTVYRTIYEREP